MHFTAPSWTPQPSRLVGLRTRFRTDPPIHRKARLETVKAAQAEMRKEDAKAKDGRAHGRMAMAGLSCQLAPYIFI